jgi:hypothetical protein
VDLRARGFLQLQYAIGRLAVFLMAPFVYLCVRLCGYGIRDLKKIRRECARLFENHRGPWIICPNHLTNIDSVILAYALAPMYAYMLNFRLLPWNLPERSGRNEARHGEVYLSITPPPALINFSRGRPLTDGQNQCGKSYLWRGPLREQRRRWQDLMRLPARRPSGNLHQNTKVR